MNQHRLPAFVKVNNQNFQEIAGQPNKLVALVVTNLNETEKTIVKALKKQVTKAVEKDKLTAYTFGYINYTQFADFCVQFSNQTPYLLVLNTQVQPWKY